MVGSLDVCVESLPLCAESPEATICALEVAYEEPEDLDLASYMLANINSTNEVVKKELPPEERQKRSPGSRPPRRELLPAPSLQQPPAARAQGKR